ncbi:hypothetical protein [Flagellimonas sp. CMM7]|uniref:hypothetical protein n=1 Tax=Flagellimonas sp. CMM7 TaxID=2654676 RepID=UPI0013D48B7A|nr:hypothetical protein [Flagellimonas sp. CMM7]UII80353.1 hypothetical protein LV704_02290 [Flagellimonas sp. CMM7]
MDTIKIAKSKYDHLGLLVAVLLFLVVFISCDNDDVNEVFPKNQFFAAIPLSASTVEIFEDESDGVFVPVSIGNTLTESGTLTFEISSGAVYGQDYTTVPDGSSGSIEVSVSTGQNTVSLQIIPLKTEAVDTKTVTLNLTEASGGLLLGTETVPYTLTIADQTLNLETIAYTSFEEPLAGTINNYAAQDGVEQINVLDDGEGNRLNAVDYVSVGGEMGFDMSYIPGEEGGEDDGLFFGVTNVVNEPDEWNIGFFKDSAQAYVTSDADGLAEIVFDEVTIPAGVEFLKIRLSTYFVDASWETSDEFDVFWRTADGDELLLSFRSNEVDELMTDAPDGTGNIIIDDWFTFDAFVSNIKTGSLVIQIGTNSGSELAFIDAIEIGIK